MQNGFICICYISIKSSIFFKGGLDTHFGQEKREERICELNFNSVSDRQVKIEDQIRKASF